MSFLPITTLKRPAALKITYIANDGNERKRGHRDATLEVAGACLGDYGMPMEHAVYAIGNHRHFSCGRSYRWPLVGTFLG